MDKHMNNLRSDIFLLYFKSFYLSRKQKTLLVSSFLHSHTPVIYQFKSQLFVYHKL